MAMDNPNERRDMPREEWFKYRHWARTNLLFLCKHVLGFVDVSLDVPAHRDIIAAAQHFTGGAETSAKDLTLDNLRKGYKPNTPLWSLKHPSPEKRDLYLCSRGFLKSSIKTVAHNIQWSLNYPDIRILISSGTGKQVGIFMTGIFQQYRFNDIFRWLFPEHVPQGKVERFGSTDHITTLARQDFTLREATYTSTSLDSAVAGGHYEVIDHDDVVNETNVRTEDSILQVNQHLSMTAPLLERRDGVPGWTSFVGTRYDYTDAYGMVLDSEKAKAKEKRSYVIVYAPAWTGDWGTESCKATWPQRLPISALRAIENDPLQGPTVLSSQYGLKPRPTSSGLITDKREIIWTPRRVLNELYASLRLHATVDLHGMAPQTAQNKHADNDYTAITLAGFGRDGHCYILSVYHGRPTPMEVIDYLFALWFKHPRIIDIKIQADHMANTLMPFLTREQTKRQRFLPLVPIPVSNQISKKQKIKALQPWFKTGVISFAEDIVPRYHVEEEIIRFPRFHDDILDTVRDQMENRQAGVVTDVMVQPKPLPEPQVLPGSNPRFLGFVDGGGELWSGIKDSETRFAFDPITGM
jgi:predicted phage terminase large subunit-like protein